MDGYVIQLEEEKRGRGEFVKGGYRTSTDEVITGRGESGLSA